MNKCKDKISRKTLLRVNQNKKNNKGIHKQVEIICFEIFILPYQAHSTILHCSPTFQTLQILYSSSLHISYFQYYQIVVHTHSFSFPSLFNISAYFSKPPVQQDIEFILGNFCSLLIELELLIFQANCLVLALSFPFSAPIP